VAFDLLRDALSAIFGLSELKILSCLIRMNQGLQTERTHTWKAVFRLTSPDYVGPEEPGHASALPDDVSRCRALLMMNRLLRTRYAEDASPIALSPDYVPESDPEADPEEDDDEDPEEDPIDYPADGGEDGDDEMDIEEDE
ncbi:hypothetical protein Tco_0105086, partial [Tanacetum coccineum]